MPKSGMKNRGHGTGRISFAESSGKMQANAEGNLSERACRRAEELADDAEIRVTPSRKNGPRKKLNGNGKVREARLPPVVKRRARHQAA